MLLRKGQKGGETVIIEDEKYLNDQEREEYERLSIEENEAMQTLFESCGSWKEFQEKCKDADKSRFVRMLEILDNARERKNT